MTVRVNANDDDRNHFVCLYGVITSPVGGHWAEVLWWLPVECQWWLSYTATASTKER